MEAAEHLRHLDREVTAFSAALADPAARVEHCPGWDVAALVRHLGGVHRWATYSVRGEPGPGEPPPPPREWRALTGWFADGARDLVDALATAGPDQPCPTMDGFPGRAGFWSRRQAHETAVHRWDAESAHGAPGGLDRALALDGIDEVAEVLLPRQLRLGRVAPGFAPVTLIPDGGLTDPGAVLSSDAMAAGVASAGATPAATVTGPADRLFLLVWHRIHLDDRTVRVTGDRVAAARTLALPLAP